MKILSSFLMVGLFVSCAADSLLLKRENFQPYKESSQVTKSGVVTKSFSIGNILDKRNKQSLGHAYTGVEYKKTPILLDVQLPLFIEDYMSEALVVRQFSIDQTSSIKLDIVVNELAVEEVIEKFQPERAKCSVTMTFSISNENKKWSGNYWATVISPGDMADGTERLSPTLASCMNEVVEKLVSDNKFIEMIK